MSPHIILTFIAFQIHLLSPILSDLGIFLGNRPINIDIYHTHIIYIDIVSKGGRSHTIFLGKTLHYYEILVGIVAVT